MVHQHCNANTLEAEAGTSLWIPGQLGLYSENLTQMGLVGNRTIEGFKRGYQLERVRRIGNERAE